MYQYNPDFYTYISQGSRHSAMSILPLLVSRLPTPVNSVLDVGCGAGAWLSVWKEQGASVLGLDGDYVRPEQLMIDENEFTTCDLTRGFDLDRTFDLVQCLEVAEHLPTDLASKLVDCMCRHSDMILFSAATPGQGGENHINEQTYGFWRDIFASRGYQMYDPIRAQVRNNHSVKPWYRYNTFLYVNSEALPATHQCLSDFSVDCNREPEDVAPMAYRLRRAIIRCFPTRVHTALAIIKKTLFNVIISLRGSINDN